MRKPKVLICTPEIIIDFPEESGDSREKSIEFRTGGLATANSAIIRELANDPDIELHVTVPKWKSGLRELLELEEKEEERISEALHRQNFYLIEDSSFNKARISGSNIMMYDDTSRFSRVDRALAFNRAIINWLFPFVNPDVVWVNDWMLGLIPAAAKQEGKKSLMTVHNIFTNYLDFNYTVKSGIDLREFRERIYFAHKTPGKQGLVDFLTTGIFSSDFMTTVSQTFLREIVSGAHRSLMSYEVFEQIAQKTSEGRARGILNPRDRNFSAFLDSLDNSGIETTIRQRKENSVELKRRTGLREGSSSLFVFPNRLYDFQKNASLLLNNMQRLASQYNSQFLIIANGEPKLESLAGRISVNSSGSIAYYHFAPELEELALSADNVYGLMTPDYEPCGRPNIVYPGEGALVVAHKVGGIADSVFQLNAENSTGNGFLYEINDAQGLEYGIRKAVEFSSLPETQRYEQLERIARENMQNHSPKARAAEYKAVLMQLYEEKMRGK